MGIFQRKSTKIANIGPNSDFSASQAILAETVLNSINEGVLIIDQNGLIKLANPAAARMTGNSSPADVMGISYLSLLRLENGEGMAIADAQNPLIKAVSNGEAWSSRDYYIVTLQGAKVPVAINLTPCGGRNADCIITFREISQELEKEGEQTEFISTASHEMRTPVASIEGYLGLALNPQTATIDERARQYLTEAHNASQHLGKLFRDLLDVTKLDDKRVKLHLQPVDLLEIVKDFSEKQFSALNDKGLKYSFGTNESEKTGKMQLEQPVYAMVDLDFLQEILNNLIENAIKYTGSGGAIWVNVRGDGDNALINVTDTGMGISPDNLTHIFQKFYRVDNSQTRTIGGTGLGLYIVKERVEAMGGRVWAESAFGEGSTFYVSLPRISQEEYERQKMVAENTQMMAPQTPQPPAGMGAAAVGAMAPVTSGVSAEAVSAAGAPEATVTAQVASGPAGGAAPAAVAAPVTAQTTGETAQTTGGVTQAAPDMAPDKLAALKQQFAAQAAANQPVAQVPKQAVVQATGQPVVQTASQPVVAQNPINQSSQNNTSVLQ